MGSRMSCRTCRASSQHSDGWRQGERHKVCWDLVSPIPSRRTAASPEGSQDGLSSWGILPTLLKSHLSFRAWRQTKIPSPSQPQKWAWPFLSLFSFIFYRSFCSSVLVLSIPRVFILHLPISHCLQTHWRHCRGNEQQGLHSLWLSLRLRCHKHEKTEKILKSR